MTSAIMALRDILLLLGAVFWGGPYAGDPATDPANMQVMIVDEAPYHTALGLTCHPFFQSVEGNAQADCPPGFKGVVVYSRVLNRGLALLLNVIRHEGKHYANAEAGIVGPPSDRFLEAEAYAAGCRYSLVSQCEQWVRVP